MVRSGLRTGAMWRLVLAVTMAGFWGCGVSGHLTQVSTNPPKGGGEAVAGLFRQFRETDYESLVPVPHVALDWQALTVGSRFRVRGNLYYRRVPREPETLELIVVDQAWLSARDEVEEPFVLCTRGFASFALMTAWVEDLDARPFRQSQVATVNTQEVSTAFVTVARDRYRRARPALALDAIRTFRGYLMRNP